MPRRIVSGGATLALRLFGSASGTAQAGPVYAFSSAIAE